MNEVIKLTFSEIVFHVLRREPTTVTWKMFLEEEDLQTLTYDNDLNYYGLRIWDRCSISKTSR